MNAPHSKCGIRATVSGVQIHPSPPGVQKDQQNSQLYDIARVLAARLVHTGGTRGPCDDSSLEASDVRNLLARLARQMFHESWRLERANEHISGSGFKVDDEDRLKIAKAVGWGAQQAALALRRQAKGEFSADASAPLPSAVHGRDGVHHDLRRCFGRRSGEIARRVAKTRGSGLRLLHGQVPEARLVSLSRKEPETPCRWQWGIPPIVR